MLGAAVLSGTPREHFRSMAHLLSYAESMQRDFLRYIEDKDCSGAFQKYQNFVRAVTSAKEHEPYIGLQPTSASIHKLTLTAYSRSIPQMTKMLASTCGFKLSKSGTKYHGRYAKYSPEKRAEIRRYHREYEQEKRAASRKGKRYRRT
jgi:hypothetical protein